jgi:hypothetical protein
MPEISVSNDLYRQIESATDDDMEATLWEMVGSYRRQNNPEAATGQ